MTRQAHSTPVYSKQVGIYDCLVAIWEKEQSLLLEFPDGSGMSKLLKQRVPSSVCSPFQSTPPVPRVLSIDSTNDPLQDSL